MAFGTSLIKWLLFVFNLLFCLIGLAVLIVGIILIVAIKDQVGGGSIGFFVPGIFFIVVGCIITIVSFFGCLGAVKENVCLVKTFIGLMSVILILTLVFFIITLVLRGKMYQWTESFVKDLISNYGTKEYKDLVDSLQSNFSCCGANNYSDWDSFYNTTGSARRVAPSCCPSDAKACVTTYTTSTKPLGIYEEGCSSKVGDRIYSKVGIVAIVFGVIIVIQVIGIVFGCIVVRKWGDKYDPI